MNAVRPPLPLDVSRLLAKTEQLVGPRSPSHLQVPAPQPASVVPNPVHATPRIPEAVGAAD